MVYLSLNRYKFPSSRCIRCPAGIGIPNTRTADWEAQTRFDHRTSFHTCIYTCILRDVPLGSCVPCDSASKFEAFSITAAPPSGYGGVVVSDTQTLAGFHVNIYHKVRTWLPSCLDWLNRASCHASSLSPTL